MYIYNYCRINKLNPYHCYVTGSYMLCNMKLFANSCHVKITAFCGYKPLNFINNGNSKQRPVISAYV